MSKNLLKNLSIQLVVIPCLLFLGMVADACGETVGLTEAVAQLRQASPEAGTQIAQQEAWEVVAAADISDLPQILAGMNDANPLAVNWLRTAADAIAERTLASTGSLPTPLLESFATDRDQPPRGRRVAYEWLTRVDDQAQQRLLPQMLDDSSLELRFDAVQQLISTANAAQDEAKKTSLLKKAFVHARDVKQVEELAKSLETLGASPDLVQHMGYLVDWQIVGPFNNADLAGFHTTYLPETDSDLTAIHQGKSGEVRWKSHQTDHKAGVVDLNKVLGDDKEVVGYAAATIVSPKPQTVQLRLATQNAAKVWLNGELVGAFEVYHSGFAIDQYVMPVELKPGENRILVKLCQNAKEMGWQKQWEFRLRTTDALGGAAQVKPLASKETDE